LRARLHTRGRSTRHISRADRVFHVLAALVVGSFVVSTLPGVRPHPGYSLLLDGVLNNIAYAVAPILCLVRARRSTTMRSSWSALAIGLALYGGGNIYWTVLIRPLDPEPFPSVADGLWLSFYPLAFAALVMILRQHTEKFTLSLWLDGIVGGFAVAALAAAAIIGPVLATSGGTVAAVVTTTAYPLLDILLLLVVVATLSLYHWRPPAGMWLFAIGLICFVGADAIYLVSTAHDTYVSGGLNDGMWVLATTVMALAPGWDDRPAGLRLSGWAVMAIPLLAVLMALGLLVRGGLHPVATGLAAATIITALIRLIVTFREATILADSHQLALTDDLTGLANRRALYLHARNALASDGTEAALLLLDLDRFKEVNDSLGHQAGDELLRYVAKRLQVAAPADSILVRLGGDEFAVLLVNVEQTVAERVALDIRAALSTPIVLDEVAVLMTASIGIAISPDHGSDMSALLRSADIAMYSAKSHRTGFSVYAETADAIGGLERLRTIEELREVVSTRGLAVHYQPKVDVRSREVVGVEALVRWNHPTRGLLPPAAFLPLVEDAGMMHELTIAVLEQSLDQIATWAAAGRRLPVAVNLSPSSLVDADLPERIEEMLNQRGLTPDLLELEITEDVIMNDRERGRDILERVRAIGVGVAVDDFGTGYSSLAYLRELPIDELKLDRSFLQPMANDPRAAAIVRATISLAHSLGLRLVAEGVEDEETADELSASGCDRAQGFFYARPLPPEQLDMWLLAHDAEMADKATQEARS
jgi:diguanylate cyclase